MNTSKLSGMTKKRGYSREFTPRVRTPESRRRLHVDWVPPTLYDKIAEQAKRQGISLRAHVLRLLSATVPHGHPVRQRQLQAAYKATQAAIRAGALVRPETCPECGSAPQKRSINMHHPDHDDPLRVEWMCDRCHALLSSKIVTWSDMPQEMRVAIKATLEREGVSMRALTLQLWKDWLGKQDTR